MTTGTFVKIDGFDDVFEVVDITQADRGQICLIDNYDTGEAHPDTFFDWELTEVKF